MENASDKQTQLQQANQQLVELYPLITTSDRHEALVHFSEFTLIQYIKGRGKNLDTAIKLLKLFRERIEKRNEFLMGEQR